MKKDKKILLDTKRLSCLELQIFTYLGKEKMTIKDIKKGFYGIASVQTIQSIVDSSPFFKSDNNFIETKVQNYKANIEYDFEPHANTFGLEISGQRGQQGKNQRLENVELYGIHRFLAINVKIQGNSNWELNITKIEVIAGGDNHERTMIGNPLSEAGSYNQNHKTFRK